MSFIQRLSPIGRFTVFTLKTCSLILKMYLDVKCVSIHCSLAKVDNKFCVAELFLRITVAHQQLHCTFIHRAITITCKYKVAELASNLPHHWEYCPQLKTSPLVSNRPILKTSLLFTDTLFKRLLFSYALLLSYVDTLASLLDYKLASTFRVLVMIITYINKINNLMGVAGRSRAVCPL